MDTPQFQKAEYGSAKAPEPCNICKQPVGATYYRVNGAVACDNCATRAKAAMPSSSHANFMRGLLFGIGGAIIGLILYATFTIVTGFYIGYVSLAVGYIVGKAMKTGSKGFGGSHYQIAAVLLTYAAVSIAAVPIAISQFQKQRHANPPAHVQSVAPSDSGTPSASDTSNTDDNTTAPARTSSSTGTHRGLGASLLYLVFLGLASPFLDLSSDPVHGAIGLVILAVGIRIAWKLTAVDDHAQIVGPFRNAAATAPPSLG
jgi:predicted lipid-binding transport protein (Tim44 family)